MTTMPVRVMESRVEDKVVNDFAINVATTNGSGSQTSNLTIIRALFKMGYRLTAKTCFPPTLKGCQPGTSFG